ncbi:hypothetical protein SAMN05216526_0587 [Ectothiorhodosinus mongolicus]|uniref:DUF2066 domain-containing protein n=1 Tax=Ectothiorhodosinus mongolicus TaxID=233100 RepID=A0A1R3VP41_9GAMM|nr:DUF2066 domain-containing protein [Ectothiorhodosinus mongolicus]SIT66410.1 hypothetical protein SAMN05216526_0587 [Ectothiorhodosinus mongolicus]
MRLLSARLLMLILVMLALLATPAAAASISLERLGEAMVAVPDRDRGTRQRAFSEALQEVVVKMTGDRAWRSDPRLEELLRQAPQWVRQYRYQESAEGTSELWVRFDAAAIERNLVDLGLPLWQRDRPNLLIWLAIQQDNERRMAHTVDDLEWWRAIESWANARGILLIEPLWDLEDQSRISAADILLGFEEGVLNASARYEPDAVALVRVQQRSGGFSARWQLHGSVHSGVWEAEAEEAKQALQQAFESMVDGIGRVMATAGLAHAQNSVEINITDIHSLSDYHRVRNYLSELAPVQRVQTHILGSDSVIFWVQLRGDSRELARATRLGNVLTPSAESELTFRLLP